MTTALYSSGSNLNIIEKELQLNLNNIANWCKCQFLELNPSKCKFMVIGAKKSDHIKFLINNNTIEKVEEYKYLGAIFDSELSYASHIKLIVKKVNIEIIFSRKFGNCSLNIKKLIYNSFVIT